MHAKCWQTSTKIFSFNILPLDSCELYLIHWVYYFSLTLAETVLNVKVSASTQALN